MHVLAQNGFTNFRRSDRQHKMAFSRSEGISFAYRNLKFITTNLSLGQIINSSSSNNNSSSPNNNSSSGASGGPSRPTPALESQLQKLIIRQVVSQFIKRLAALPLALT